MGVHKHRLIKLGCIAFGISIMYFLIFQYLGCDLGITTVISTYDESTVKAKIVGIASQAMQAPSNTKVDIIRQNDGDTFMILELNQTEYLQAPAKWCGENRNQSDFSISNALRTCFPTVIPTDNSTVKKSLRLIRDTFALSEIRFVITYGSLLGSLRYHKRMPFDCDFDLLVHREDRGRALQVLLRLASDPMSQMRIFDLTPAGANAKVGLACGRGSSWMNPDRWRKNGSSVTLYNGIPTSGSWKPFLKMIESCEIYIDIYSYDAGDAVLNTLNKYKQIYRPLEGTLFRVFESARKYLEDYYGSSLDLCVPKTPLMVHGQYKFLLPDCRNFVVPCSSLDTLYPRVFTFKVARPSTTHYEVGLKLDEEGKCWIHSVFLVRSLARG